MVEVSEGKAEGGFREWAEVLVAGSRLRRGCRTEPKGLGWAIRDAAATGRRRGAGTGRPIRARRLDLVTEQWAPVPDLAKLEPLTEP
jgi:hypothetical protein